MENTWRAWHSNEVAPHPVLEFGLRLLLVALQLAVTIVAITFALLATVGLVLLVAAIPVLLVVLLAAAIPRVTRAVSAGVRKGLAASVGDAFVFDTMQIDRAAMVDRLRADLSTARTIVAPEGEVHIVAHSLGAAITYLALQESTAARKVTRVTTIGGAIRPLIVPTMKKDAKPAIGHGIDWVDLYSSFDPVPGGPLPGAGKEKSSQGLSRHIRVHNDQSPLTDHTSYFTNLEEVIAPIALSILSAAYGDDEDLVTRRDAAKLPLPDPKGVTKLEPLGLRARLAVAANMRKNRKVIQGALAWWYAIGAGLLLLNLEPSGADALGIRVAKELGEVSWLPSALHDANTAGPGARVLVALIGFVLAVAVPFRAWDHWAGRGALGSSDRIHRHRHILFCVPALVPAVAAYLTGDSRAWIELGFLIVGIMGTIVGVLVLVGFDASPRGPITQLRQSSRDRQAKSKQESKPRDPVSGVRAD